jgi:hypothetical protein
LLFHSRIPPMIFLIYISWLTLILLMCKVILRVNIKTSKSIQYPSEAKLIPPSGNPCFSSPLKKVRVILLNYLNWQKDNIPFHFAE